jgi:hypothetical protein
MTRYLTTSCLFLGLLACCSGAARAQDPIMDMQRQSARRTQENDDKIQAKAEEICSKADSPARDREIARFKQRYLLASFRCEPGKPLEGDISEETKDKVTPEDWAKFQELCWSKASEADIARLLEKYAFESYTCPPPPGK